MDTSLLDLTPGLATSARVVGELPAAPSDVDPPAAEPGHPPDADGTEEAERDCKPD